MPFTRREAKQTFQETQELDKATGVSVCWFSHHFLVTAAVALILRAQLSKRAKSHIFSFGLIKSSGFGLWRSWLLATAPARTPVTWWHCWTCSQLATSVSSDPATSQPGTARAAELSLNQIHALLSVEWLENWAALKWGRGKDFWNHLPLCHRASERQSPAFCLAWRDLELGPALPERADGDAEGLKPASSREETHSLRGHQGQDDSHDSPLDNGSKAVFGELLWTVLLAT